MPLLPNSAFVFPLSRLSSRELAQLKENILHPVRDGIAYFDFERCSRALEEIEQEEERRPDASLTMTML